MECCRSACRPHVEGILQAFTTTRSFQARQFKPLLIHSEPSIRRQTFFHAMTIDIATPAMLFPAISLLLLAYTNRFLTLATLIRNFSKEERDDNTVAQIKNLRLRIQLIKRMQIAGVGSFFLCVVSMLAIYLNYQHVGNWIFAASLVSLLYSLWMSVREILISVEALDFHLEGMKQQHDHDNLT